MQRGRIEQFHYALKSGCEVEKLQERSMENNAVGIDAFYKSSRSYEHNLYRKDTPLAFLYGLFRWRRMEGAALHGA
jgi:hypothetical protein